jgi:predicted MarR family transcription regulator
MSTYDDLAGMLMRTDAVQSVLDSLKSEPVALLFHIYRQSERTGGGVPDHHIPLSGYLREVALRALIGAGLIERTAGGKLSIYTYRPTALGLDYCRKLESEGWKPGA